MDGWIDGWQWRSLIPPCLMKIPLYYSIILCTNYSTSKGFGRIGVDRCFRDNRTGSEEGHGGSDVGRSGRQKKEPAADGALLMRWTARMKRWESIKAERGNRGGRVGDCSHKRGLGGGGAAGNAWQVESREKRERAIKVGWIEKGWSAYKMETERKSEIHHGRLCWAL